MTKAVNQCFRYRRFRGRDSAELRKLGWVEGKNLTIEYRFAEQKRERLPELAADLVRLKVDPIMVTTGPTLALACETLGVSSRNVKRSCLRFLP